MSLNPTVDIFQWVAKRSRFSGRREILARSGSFLSQWVAQFSLQVCRGKIDNQQARCEALIFDKTLWLLGLIALALVADFNISCVLILYSASRIFGRKKHKRELEGYTGHLRRPSADGILKQVVPLRMVFGSKLLNMTHHTIGLCCRHSFKPQASTAALAIVFFSMFLLCHGCHRCDSWYWHSPKVQRMVLYDTVER